jgi:DNA-binding transcriptional MerR regulator
MAKYIHFTDEEKEQANRVDLEHFLLQQGENLISSGREKRLASNHSITVRGNEWYDHATEEGGYAIDFVKNFYGVPFPDAMTMLLGGSCGTVYRKASEKVVEPKKPFKLPPENKDMRRTFAYLLKHRSLDSEVLSYFAKEKLIYESLEKSKDGKHEFHNAIFVGYDENGVARHAHKRGIYSEGKSYKGNIDSSNPCYSFNRKGTSNRLYVFEAPIDLLSFISLYKNADWQNHSYVALCGLSEQAMLKQLDINENLKAVVLCLDNDNAGQKACDKFEKLLAERELEVSRLLPTLKDFNEDLKEMQKEQTQEMKLEMA